MPIKARLGSPTTVTVSMERSSSPASNGDKCISRMWGLKDEHVQIWRAMVFTRAPFAFEPEEEAEAE